MVKKSLFARLFHRSQTPAERGGGRTAETTRTRGRTSTPVSTGTAGAQKRSGAEAAPKPGNGVQGSARPGADPQRMGVATSEAEPNSASTTLGQEFEQAKPAEGPPVRTSKMSRDEEVHLKLKEGFQGISSVLTGIDQKIDQHQQSSADLMVQVRKIPEMMKDVPDASRAGVELLATISAILESQGKATHELLEKMGDLPASMKAFEERMDSMSQSNEAVAQTSRDTQERVSSAFQQVRDKVDGLSTAHEKKQDQLVREMRRQQADQDRRVDELIRRSNNSTKLVVFLIVVVIAALLLVVHQLGQT